MSVRFEIHPSIGVARVGTSNRHFVFAGPASATEPRRDATGVIRQAAEFRVYRCERDATGRMTQAEEVTAANATIRWSVHVANRKATAERFALGLGRRNNASGNDTTDRPLIIDAGEQTVSGPGDTKSLDGAFQNKPVKLGQISVAPNGRLIFVGGDGRAESPSSRPIVNFADNDGWFDSTSDGVIRASITPNGGGQATNALAAWVVVGPPDFAPGIGNLVTMYDVLVDLAIARNIKSTPQPIVFTRHVRPILERAMAYQWVNLAARVGFPGTGSGGHSSDGLGDFNLEMANLGDPTTPNTRRARIFAFLRDPAAAAHVPNRRGMPRLNDDEDTGDVFPLPPTMYNAMRLWSLGQFINDAAPELENEPETLTRIALEACAGGPFFPGIEAGRIMREASRYMPNEAFRLSPDQVKPGEITQNNAVPWQADYHECRWEEGSAANPKRLGWWPAQRPDDVLTSTGTDPVPWARGIPDSGEGLVDNWHRLGFVKEVPPGSGIFLEQERDQALPDIGMG
jgi:L-Lysine epsilon oxidase N-terminal/L-lysine epsilon oxidase C-terminal domain